MIRTYRSSVDSLKMYSNAETAGFHVIVVSCLSQIHRQSKYHEISLAYDILLNSPVIFEIYIAQIIEPYIV